MSILFLPMGYFCHCVRRENYRNVDNNHINKPLACQYHNYLILLNKLLDTSNRKCHISERI